MTTFQTTAIEPVSMSEVLEIATWDRQRSDDEIEAFISGREAAIASK